MAQTLNPPARRRAALREVAARSGWLLLAAGAALLGAPPAVRAGDLRDPTLPPQSHAAPAAAPGGAAAAPAAALQVQMILRGPGEQRTALIAGRALHVGDSLDGGAVAARVVRITDDAVELQRGATRETLELVPGQALAVRCARHGASARGEPGKAGGC